MGCLETIATEAVSKLGDLVVESTMKQFEYLIHHKKIVSNLKEEHQKLKGMKEALQGMVDSHKRSGLEIAPHVETWLSKVEAIEEKVRLCEIEENANQKCFGGLCPNLAHNYSLGKRATKRTEDITRLTKEKMELDPLSFPKPLPTVGSTFTQKIKGFESRNKIIRDVIENLKDDKFKILSICGMGGVGKTTLVKEVIRIAETNKLFDKVAMTAVSQNPSYEKMQIDIADMLGLQFKATSMAIRAGELLDYLKRIDKVLIVLDDVWTELDFEKIGLPSLEHEKICKILFTSRDEQVCHRMGSQKNFPVYVLSEEEAWDLFRDMAGSDVVDKTDIHSIAIEVAKECRGLPLAIVTLGKMLGNKAKPQWQDALEQLRHSEMDERVHSSVGLSIQSLGTDERKYCLFLCGLFPEDFDIPVESLLRHGVGMGLIKSVGALGKARNRVDTLVDNLKRCFLLLESQKAGCVKMHDIVRDVVLSIAKEHGFVVKGNDELQQKEGDYIKAMSLILDDTNDLENGSNCPALELLQVLPQTKESIPWPENFMQAMKKIRVLMMKKLSIPAMPSLFQASVILRTLQLEGCDVGDVSVIGKQLLKLEILSFSHSNVKELPTEIGQLGLLRLLDLTGCDQLDFISANVFARLSRLEELYFRVKNFAWMLNEVVLIELRKLCEQLKVFEIRVRKVETLPHDLSFRNLERFWIYVVPYSNYDRVGYLEPKRLQFNHTSYNSIKSSSIMQLVEKCEILILEKVKDMKYVISELNDGGLQCNIPIMKSLSLNNLENLSEICKTSDHSGAEKSLMEFSSLEKLELMNLPNLIGFSNTIDLIEAPLPTNYGLSHNNEPGGRIQGHQPESNLKPSGHKKLFSCTEWMQQFPKLETILLENCTSLETIFNFEGCSQSNSQPLSVLFPHLQEINISYLEKLTYVWSNAPHFVYGFQNLRSLSISGCDSLSYVFTSAVLRAITNLERLQIGSCKSMETLVIPSPNNEEGDYKDKGKDPPIVLNKLKVLFLWHLPKLVNICQGSAKLEWPSLTQLLFLSCPMLQISLIPTQLQEKLDNFGVASNSNKEDTRSSNFKENRSMSSHWPLRCTPWPLKSVGQRHTNKRANKALSLAHDLGPATFEMKNNVEISHRVPILESLEVHSCGLLHELFLIEEKYNPTPLSCVKTIDIGDCDKLKTIMFIKSCASEERMDVMTNFSQLESIRLFDLPNLVRFSSSGIDGKLEDMGPCEESETRIQHNPFMDGLLAPNLKSLNIERCDKINIVFSYSTLRSLEELIVGSCKNIEEIVSEEKIGDEVMFPRLKSLSLVWLPNLKAFCQGSYDFDFPLLQQVIIEECPNMEVFSRGSTNAPKLKEVTMRIDLDNTICVQNGDLNAVIEGFKGHVALQGSEMMSWSVLHNKHIFKYSEMGIANFHKLLMLVPCSEINMLQHVRQLGLAKCDSLEEVFESEGGIVSKKGYATANYELRWIYLQDLPNLRSIWGPNITRLVSFDKLATIEINGCHSLKSLLSYSMARSLVQLNNLDVRNCEMIEEIVTKEDNHWDECYRAKALFPKLERLYLEGLPNLRCVCSGDDEYDIPLCDEEEKEQMQMQISFPQLQDLTLRGVPNLKCFCPGANDYYLMLSSSCIQESNQVVNFPSRKVSLSAPELHVIKLGYEFFLGIQIHIRNLGDLNLTIQYIHDSKKYKAELQELETLTCIDQHQYQHLREYITRVSMLELHSCHKLLSCFPSNMMHLVQHLEVLRVQQCRCLEKIFQSNDCEGMQLTVMEMYSLPKLKHIWRNHGPISGFQNITILIIEECHDLKFVFPDVSIARSLPNLSSLKVEKCNKMEEIIPNSKDENSIPREAKILFSCLEIIRLKELPELKCFCTSSFYFELPLCQEITIQECPKMKTFCHGTLYTPELWEFTIEGTQLDKGTDVNDGIHEIKRRVQQNT